MTDLGDNTNPSGTPPVRDRPTEQIVNPPVAGADGGAPSAPPWRAAVAHDDAWPVRGPRRGIKMSIPTVVMLALLIAAGGIWGGAALQRGEGTSSGSSSLSSLASLFRGAGSTGAGSSGRSGAGGFGAAAVGTVTEVSGSTLYVTNASGDLVKVTVGPSTAVNRNAKSSLSALQVGDTVVVEGSKASNGSVTATSVSATASGVTTGAGGFGGFGG